MFVIDITFTGDSPSTETVYVRRPSFVVSAASSGHVIVPEMESLGFDLTIRRELGHKFKVLPTAEDTKNIPSWLGGIFDGTASITLGDVSFFITALDLDLVLSESEAFDRAGIRILRRAFVDTVPEFPAVMITAPSRAIVSFAPDQPLVIGRSRQSSVRLDLPTISNQHARIGFESGQFWVEDLGSTNGTFVGDRQVSSRMTVAPGVPIHLSKSVSVVGIVSEAHIAEIESVSGEKTALVIDRDLQYPSLISLSEVARPSRLALKRGTSISMGRAPSSELWLGAPHVSRRHCVIDVSLSGLVAISDTSTNGTAYDGGILRASEVFQTTETPIVLDFGAGVTVGLCFSEEQERRFTEADGAPDAFLMSAPPPMEKGRRVQRKGKRDRRTTTWFNLQLEQAQSQVAKGAFIHFKMFFQRLTLSGRVVVILVVLGFIGLLGLMGSMVVTGL